MIKKFVTVSVMLVLLVLLIPQATIAENALIPSAQAESVESIAGDLESDSIESKDNQKLKIVNGGVMEEKVTEVLLDIMSFLKRAECDFDYFPEIKEAVKQALKFEGENFDVEELQIVELNGLEVHNYDEKMGPLVASLNFPVLFEEDSLALSLLGFEQEDEIAWVLVPSFVDDKGNVNMHLVPELLALIEEQGALICIMN